MSPEGNLWRFAGHQAAGDAQQVIVDERCHAIDGHGIAFVGVREHLRDRGFDGGHGDAFFSKSRAVKPAPNPHLEIRTSLADSGGFEPSDPF